MLIITLTSHYKIVTTVNKTSKVLRTPRPIRATCAFENRTTTNEDIRKRRTENIVVRYA